MPTRNVVKIVAAGRANFPAKTGRWNPSNGKEHRTSHQAHSTATVQKFLSQRRKSRYCFASLTCKSTVSSMFPNELIHFFCQAFVSGLTTQKKEELLIILLSNGKGSLDYAKNMTFEDDGGDPSDPPGEDVPDWCVCSHCVPVENPQEQKCCGLKKCITSFQLFPNLCLDRNVLEVAIKARCDMRADEIDFSTSSYRKAAYRQYILWRYGRLGKGNRRVCPSCVVRMIRITYPAPDGIYMGFKPH